MSLLCREFFVHNLSCQGSHVHVCEANYSPYILVLLLIFALANSLNVNSQDIYFIILHCISSYFGNIHNAKHEIRLILILFCSCRIHVVLLSPWLMNIVIIFTRPYITKCLSIQPRTPTDGI